MAILRQFEKFGSRLKKGFTDFNVKAGKGLAQAGKFIEQKALPVAQNVAGVVAKVARTAAPILLASGVGAELAPLALGIAAGAGATERAIGTGRKVLKAARQVADAVKTVRQDAKANKMITVAGQPRPAVVSTIEKSIPMATQVQEVRGDFGKEINKSNIPIAYPVQEVRGVFGT
jgi:hypothetical protein